MTPPETNVTERARDSAQSGIDARDAVEPAPIAPTEGTAGRQLLEPPPLKYHVSPLKAEELREEYVQLPVGDPRRSKIAEEIDIAEGRAAYNEALAKGAAVEEDDEWPHLDRPTLPAFPLKSFPKPMRLFAEAVATETQTPVDLAAALMLAALAAAAQGAEVRVKGKWVEQSSLYMFVMMSSGERKSSVLSHVARPLYELESRRREEEASSLRRRLKEISVIEKQIQGLESQAAKSAGDESKALLAEICELEDRLAELGAPCEYRLLADDSTPEALASLLVRHGSIGILTAEGAILANALGHYSDKARLDTLTKAYGAESFTIDRTGREPQRAESPRLTIGLTAQEHVIQALIDNPIANAQGLVSRFAFVLPQSMKGSRDPDPPDVNPLTEEAWRLLVEQVYTRAALPQLPQPGPEGGSGGSGSTSLKGVGELSLSPSASELRVERAREWEPKVGPGGELEPISAWMQRHDGRAIRIALLLHLASAADPSEPIERETLEAGYEIAEYLLAHSKAAITAPDPLVRKAERVLAARAQPEVSQRDLYRWVLNARGDAEEAARLADSLLRRGSLKPGDTPSHGPEGGRPASPRYRVNPALLPDPQISGAGGSGGHDA